jgi:hypothetical protein
MGKKIPTWWENKFHFMTRNYIFRRVDEGIKKCCFFSQRESGLYPKTPPLYEKWGF